MPPESPAEKDEPTKAEEKPAKDAPAEAKASEPEAKSAATEVDSEPLPVKAKEKKEEKEPFLTRGNLPRWKRGGITALVGGFLAFLLMAHNGQLRFGVPARVPLHARRDVGCARLVRVRSTTTSSPSGRSTRSQVATRARSACGGAGLLFCAALMGGQSGALHAVDLGRARHAHVRAARLCRLQPRREARAVGEGRDGRRAAALEAPRLLARRRSPRSSTCPRSAATRSGIRGRRTTARSRARSSRATTGSRSGGRKTAGSGRSRS